MDFKHVLKTLYKKQNHITPVIEGLEGEIPQQTLNDFSTKLQTIIKEDDDKKQGNYETIAGQKQEVEIENIFSEPLIHRLLIIGGAGVGKSTLMQYMAYRWSQDSLWNDKFDYIYRVPLKILLNTGWNRDYSSNQRQDELKCLIHHNLIVQGAGCKLEDMPWLEKKDKILLLCDGYDEVSHERNGKFKGLFESIFKHENIILTSRPNAVDKQMAQRFGKKIENIGLDYDGINKYLTQYFKKNPEKGTTLQEFLHKNSSFKAICHIPANLAMLCFIWSEGDSNWLSHKISNLSDLYKQVLDHLGFRYYTQSNPKQNVDDLMSQWKGREIQLDELQVLEYTAYKGMTGGGIQVPEDKRFETLIVKGMTEKGDKDGVSVQSSINYLAAKLSKSLPTINKVYNYGLLRPEGAQKQSKKETDLPEQNFSFIHLSFQEFLTASYFVKNLLKENNQEEQDNIADFIAQHRNEPRYLMTFKLMAGLLSAHNGDNHQGVTIFWDAIMCNLDGVLELGAEIKVTLLMHLLNQTKKNEQVDERIPNFQVAVDLIDSVVLQDLARWSPQLKESDFLSPNIKEGLLQFLINNNPQWMSEMSSKLQVKFNKQIQKSHDATTETVVEIILSFINKFSQDQQNQIITKLTELIQNHTTATWTVTKTSLEALITIHQRFKITPDYHTKEKLFEIFLSTAYDINLTQSSTKAIQRILNIEANPLLMDRLKADLREHKHDMKIEGIVEMKSQMLNLVNESQLSQDVIQTSFVPFLEASSVATAAQKILTANKIIQIIAKTNLDKEFALQFTKLLFPLLRDPQINDSISHLISELTRKTGNLQLIQDRINMIIPESKDPNHETVRSVFRELSHLINIKGGIIDSQLVSDILQSFVKRVVPSSSHDLLLTDLNKFVNFTCKNNPQTTRAALKDILPLLDDSRPSTRSLVLLLAKVIIDSIDENDTQLINDILDIIIPSIQSSAGYIDYEVWNLMTTLLLRSKHPHQSFFEKLVQLFQNTNADTQNLILSIFAQFPPKNEQLALTIINPMILLLKQSKIDAAMLALPHVLYYISCCRDLGPQFTTGVLIKSLVPLIQSSPDELKSELIDTTTQIISFIENLDAHLQQDLTKALIPLLKSSDPKVKKALLKSLETITAKSSKWNPQHTRDPIKALVPLLNDPDHLFRTQVLSNIITFVSLEDKIDTQFRKEVINSLTPLVQDAEKSVKKALLNGIGEILIMTNDPQLCRDTLKTFKSNIQDPNFNIRNIVAAHLVNMVRVDKTLLRDVVNILSENSEALSSLVDRVKIGKKNGTQLAKDIPKLLSPHLQNPTTFNNLKGLANAINDVQFGRDIIDLMTPFLKDPRAEIRLSAASNIAEVTKIASQYDMQFVQNIIQLLTPLVKDSEPKIRARVVFVLLPELIDKKDVQLVRNTFDLGISLLQELDDNIKTEAIEDITEFVRKINLTSLTTMNTDNQNEVVWLKKIVSSLTSLSHISIPSEIPSEPRIYFPDLREAVSQSLLLIGTFTNDTELAKAAAIGLTQLISDSLDDRGVESAPEHIRRICADRDVLFLKDVIDSLYRRIKNADVWAQGTALSVIGEIAEMRPESLSKDVIKEMFLPYFEEGDTTFAMESILSLLLANRDHTDTQFAKEIIEKFVASFPRFEKISLEIASKIIREILSIQKDSQLAQDVINLLSPYLRDPEVFTETLKIQNSVLLLNLDAFLTHPSGDLKSKFTSFLLACFPKYLHTFQIFDRLLQRPLSDLTSDIIIKELFNYHKFEYWYASLQKERMRLKENISRYLDNSQEEELRGFLVSEINKIETLKGPGIIELALVVIGNEQIPKDGSSREKLLELAREVLNVQLKYLNEEGLKWINNNCEKLLSLSPEAKVFYKKVFGKLLEDGQISSFQVERLIEFIKQGSTVSLTRDGQMIFEGKRYKLKGENIELTLEKIAKSIIDQQDILAIQYKKHEPIFKLHSLKGRMKQPAADIKKIRSIVDSERSLKTKSWLLTRLKSLKFNSEIFLLEQRTAFGDHLVYHWGHQKLVRFYPGETPALQEFFGSCIYGEAYQGEVFKLTDLVAQKLLEHPDTKPSAEGKLKSKQIYFQQELLKQGNEDRNRTVEEELVKKLDMNRAILETHLNSLKLQDSEKLIIKDYYEGFVLTFSSVYTTSQAIDSGELFIDDGEDFFSPVKLFIQLTSLAPFGIGDILSNGLEAARSSLKSTTITNEAKFVKDFAIDAVELSDLVSKTVLNIISNEDQRKRILEAKDDVEQNNLIMKVKNLVMEKIEKLKNLAEKSPKMKNLFEKEIETSPAFRLGESNANRILKEWIDMKGSQPDLEMKKEEKLEKFVKSIAGENVKIIDFNKITIPLPPTSPQEGSLPVRNKSSCCEIF